MMSHPSLAQQKKTKTVTLDAQNEPIEALLEEMSNQLGISISAHSDLLGTLISIQLENATAEAQG